MGAMLVWLRWVQFVDLGLVFGAGLSARLLGQRWAFGGARTVLALGCALGIALAGGEFALVLSRMADMPLGQLDPSLVSMMLTGSALGWAAMGRMAALGLALLVLLIRPRAGLAPVAALGAVATASLAWGGHAAASMGGQALVRLGGDIAHLWAGLTWLGALLLFTAQVWTARADGDHAPLARGLAGFALIGTVLVGVLVVSGIGNLLFLASPGEWAQMASTPYGRLILTKLALFAGMLALAAHNRFHLVPALEHGRTGAIAALRRSVSLETVLALGVVWCIAYAGTLDPMGGA